MHEIVEGRVAVWPQASRHHNFHVLRRPSPGYSSSRQWERRKPLLSRARRRYLPARPKIPVWVFFALCAPHFWAYIRPSRRILEHLRAVEPLGVYQLRMGRPPEAAALLGQVLAKLHRSSRAVIHF